MNIMNEKYQMYHLPFLKQWAFLCLFFLSIMGFSQSNLHVTSSLDTNSIRIGEQLKFIVNVKADSSAQVIFPESQTFSPLEMVEAFATDTVRENAKLSLIKKYILTQFDSGSYTLPQQKIIINDKVFLTDSLKVFVNTVPVDTTKQQMYGIKDIMNVEETSASNWEWILGIVLSLVLIIGLLYWFVWKKKKLTELEKIALLPPYDRAMLELKKLENSKYLIQDEYKEYYSELTTIVRSYLEEDVHISALESTTDQLIEKLELLKDTGNLKLENDTIVQFKKILQTSDLVKFAKSKPDKSVAEQDRKSIENIVTKTKEAIPPPTEEELHQQEEYKQKMTQKKHRKKIITAVIATSALLIMSFAGAIRYFGYNYVKDTILGHPTKELLKGEWVSSLYGFPPVHIETPKVLLREEVRLPPELKENIKQLQVFSYTSAIGLFHITVSVTTFLQEVEPDFEQSADVIIQNLENKGAKNIVTKTENFNTISGTKGIKTYGTAKFPVPESNELLKGEYAILTFAGKGFQQQVVLTWLENDPYAQDIIARILSTVDVKTE